jgi:hypothetical protein
MERPPTFVSQLNNTKLSSRSATRDLLQTPCAANRPLSKNPTTRNHCHPERSEGSAFHNESPRSFAKENPTKTPLSSSGHGLSRAEYQTIRSGFSRLGEPTWSRPLPDMQVVKGGAGLQPRQKECRSSHFRLRVFCASLPDRRAPPLHPGARGSPLRGRSFSSDIHPAQKEWLQPLKPSFPAKPESPLE